MRRSDHSNSILWLAVIALGLIATAPTANAGDLPAVSDGQHLWLVEQAPAPADDKDAGPQLIVYHLPTGTETYLAAKLEPIAGQLMPRGVAAGDGRLLIVTDDRQLITLGPIWSDLLQRWEYRQRSLTDFPQGCTLLSLAMGSRGPWALVQVQSRELLEQLDQINENQQQGSTDQQMLNRALGLPDDLQWGDSDDAAFEEDALRDEMGKPSANTSDTDEQSAPAESTAEAKLPAYRLIHLSGSEWVSSPLPKAFEMPREAKLLIRPGDDRPTLLVDSDTASRHLPVLVRYNPVGSVEQKAVGQANDAAETNNGETTHRGAPAWSKVATGMQFRSGRQWSAGLIKGQVFIAVERNRPQEVVTIDTFLLRGDDAYEIGYVNINTGDNARWALFAKQNDIGLIASPAAVSTQEGGPPPLALLSGLRLPNGQALFPNEQGRASMVVVREKQPTAFEGNADLVIQIFAFITAMIMMMLFYRHAPQQGQLDLPDHLVFASLSRRAMAGVIDLTPGFILAGLIYDVTIGEVVLESWPGNGVGKAFVAMRPGFVVIGVTLLHTTITEFILARSLGKVLMGMYVSDLNGKPAPPMACLGRSLSRAFELFAPLMILVAVISPARQRLGDILAKTTVVMRKPEEIEELDDQ